MLEVVYTELGQLQRYPLQREVATTKLVEQLLDSLAHRHIEAELLIDDTEIGAVRRLDGEWMWYFDPDICVAL